MIRERGNGKQNGRPVAEQPERPDGERQAEAQLGLVQWFRMGDRDQVRRVLEDLQQLGVAHLRTGISWADFHRPGGKDWFDWLLPCLAEQVELLPCFMYTPPSLGIEPTTIAPPRTPKDFADFVDIAITEWGKCFDAIELWNEPTNPNHWDRRLDPDWRLFSDMINKAAYWAKHRGKQTVLAGVCPSDFDWLRVIGQQGVLRHIDVVGIHALPGTWEHDPHDWRSPLTVLGDLLQRFGSGGPIWITEAGYSTWQQDQHRQVLEFVRLADAPVERIYWYSIEDLHPDVSLQDGSGWSPDERHFHYGLKRIDGSPKLLYRILSAGGMDAVREFANLARHHGRNGYGIGHGATRTTTHNRLRSAAAAPPRLLAKKPVLVTGGAGFIGTNLAARLLDEGHRVIVYDNLSRPGVENNLNWLLGQYGNRVEVEVNDVRDAHALRRVVERVSAVFHLAAQVAVTTSLVDPITDFNVNAAGTLNVLEAIRHCDTPPPVLFTSTNKVYGNLDDVPLCRKGECYVPVDRTLRERGVAEDRPLDFHSPYGCSKGVADQYVLDYARCYRLPTVVFRMSCIYGPHQCGNEDQGWVAHFAKRLLDGEPITLYGDGYQVRDVLFVEDLVAAMLRAVGQIDRLAGRAFNMGGGPENAVSLLEVIDRLAELQGREPKIDYGPWRQGDQRYYVSDTRAFQKATGWKTQVPAHEGIRRLADWLAADEAENKARRALSLA